MRSYELRTIIFGTPIILLGILLGLSTSYAIPSIIGFGVIAGILALFRRPIAAGAVALATFSMLAVCVAVTVVLGLTDGAIGGIGLILAGFLALLFFAAGCMLSVIAGNLARSSLAT